MTTPEAIRKHFAGNRFGSPCSADQIARAESMLGQPIPDSLRELYLAFDGFSGPASTSFLWPLFSSEAMPGFGLVDSNLHLRADTVSQYPAFVFDTLFFGGNEQIWGINRDLPDQIVGWEAWEDDFQVVGRAPLELWLAEKKCYDELDNAPGS